MNKKLTALLFALGMVGTTFGSANNRTEMNVRISRDTIPAYTTFNEMICDKNNDRIGGFVEGTVFYGRSNNGAALGRNFGADGTNSIFLRNERRATHASGGQLPSIDLNARRPQVWNDLLLHNVDNLNNTLTGSLKFDPKQTSFGVRLDYLQRLDKWVDGLYFHVILPIVNVKNDLNMTHTGLTGIGALTAGTESVSLNTLLKGGTVTRLAANAAAGANNQSALTHGKMANNSETGLGDLELRVGWRFLQNDKYHAGLNGAVLFPTADDRDGEFLWEAVTGESKWALGLGLDGAATLWEEKDQNLKICGNLNYRYLFEGSERRTLPLNTLTYSSDATGAGTFKTISNPILSPYYLVGDSAAAAATSLKPLANVSTLNIDVKPGSQIDGTVSLAYNNGCFCMDLGYNLFWKERESISLKQTWSNNKYGVPAGNFRVDNNQFDQTDSIAGTAAPETQAFIQSSHLDPTAAETPSQVVHKFFLGLGYYARTWDYPVMLGAGAAYELPSSNRDACEGYSLWGKLGIAF